MPNGCCCVPGCSNRSGHLFPKDKDRQKKWIVAIRRDNFEPSPFSIVCRNHFSETDYHQTAYSSHGNERCKKYLKRNAVPSIFTRSRQMTAAQANRRDRYSTRRDKEQKLAFQELKKKTEKQEQERVYGEFDIRTSNEVCVQAEGCQEESMLDSSSYMLSYNPATTSCVVQSVEPTVQDKPSHANFSTTLSTSCSFESETMVDPAASQPYIKCKTKTKPYLSVEAIKSSDKLVHFYTGLETFDVFMHAFWSLGDNVNHLEYAYGTACKSLSPVNQFLLMLVKLRRHYPHIELARMFGVQESGVQNVFVTWINFCYFQWKEVDWWPDRNLVTHHCPLDFKRQFPCTRVIVDATEIRVKHPTNPKVQRASFSTYRHANTVKVLIGVTPCGLTSFVSDAFGGSASDRQIVERTALTTLCSPNDSIMADKGFNVQDIFAVRDIHINIPAFFKKRNRLAPATRHNDRKITSEDKRSFIHKQTRALSRYTNSHKLTSAARGAYSTIA